MDEPWIRADRLWARLVTDPTATPFSGVAGFPDQVFNPPPFDVTYTVNGTGVLADWTPGAEGALYYDVYVGRAPDRLFLTKTRVSTLTYQITGLTHGTLYYFQIVAYQGPRLSVGSVVTQVYYT